MEASVNPRANKYPASCSLCRQAVAAGAGVLSGGPGGWVTHCQACSAKMSAMAVVARPKLVAALDRSGRVLVTFSGFGDIFYRYIEVCKKAGFRYDPEVKAQFGAVDQVPELVVQAQSAGFDVAVQDALQAAIQARAAEARAEIADSDSRMADMTKELEKRNLFLRPFQRETVRWVVNRKGAIIGHDPGLGKTIISLAAMPKGVPILVIPPASVKYNWQQEAKKWRPDLETHVISGMGNFRWPKPGEMVIVNARILPDMDFFKANVPPADILVIVDEAHEFKNFRWKKKDDKWEPDGSGIALKLFAIAEMARARGGRVWLLTGTPVLNRPDELWALLSICGCANEVFSNKKRFNELMGAKVGGGGYGIEWGTPSPEVGELLKRCMLRFAKADVLTELPPVTIQKRTVTISAKDKKALDVIEQELEVLEGESEIEGINLDAEISAAQRMALDTAMSKIPFEKISKVKAAVARAKIPSLVELVEEYEAMDQPLLVFSDHVDPVEVVGSRPGWAKVAGDVDAKTRLDIQNRFQAGELKGVALTIKAGGVGMTLTKAHFAIFNDKNWIPEINRQAVGRVDRFGQTAPILITELVADHSIDRRIEQICRVKEKLVESTTGAATMSPEMQVQTTADKFDQVTAILDQQATMRIERERAAIEAEKRMAEERRKLEAERAALEAERKKPGSARPIQPREGDKWHPATPLEKWAAEGVMILAGFDADRARERNDVGFNQSDGAFGHSLATQIRNGKPLSAKQWDSLIRMLRKYHRQIGPAPDGTSASKNPVDCWRIVVTDDLSGREESAIAGPDDARVSMIGGKITHIDLAKDFYTSEEAVEWAKSHDVPWIRVEG